jgi:DNA invertase Pin-like site-specific DNA recombinase
MIAAVYARKSTDQKDTADEQKSVARQVEAAKACARSKGWTVDPGLVLIDDGISGAEFDRRPAFTRLMELVKHKRAPFQVLLVNAIDRLCREQWETQNALKNILKARIRVWIVYQDREFTVDNPEDKLMIGMTMAFADYERVQGQRRTTAAMMAKARAGLVTGGRTFGYENVRKAKGHVERRILESEAKVIRMIYKLYAAGGGYRSIAHHLNAKRVPSPRAQRGRPSGWDMGTVKAVLERPIYRGVYRYNATKKRDAWGEQKITKRPTEQHVVFDMPELRIVPKELTDQVDALLAKRKEIYLRSNDGRLLGQPSGGKYLLSGLMKCPCGANFEAQKNPRGMKVGHVYICAAHRRKGPAVCANALALPIEETEDRILNVIEGEVLTPTFIEMVLDTVFVPDDGDRAALEAEADQLDLEIGRLTAAIKAGADIPTVVAELKTANARLQEVRRRLSPQEHHSRAELREALEQRVAEWRQVLRTNSQQGRQVLRHLLGEVRLWVGTVEDLAIADAARPGDSRGTEGITAADCAWTASAQVEGLRVGLPGFGAGFGAVLSFPRQG